MIPPRFDPDARADFLGAIAYYEACRPGLGRRFRQAVEAAINKACETPLSYRVLLVQSKSVDEKDGHTPALAL